MIILFLLRVTIMSNKSKIQILVEHSIDYKVEGSTLYAESVYSLLGVAGSEWMNISNWSRSKLIEWLGY